MLIACSKMRSSARAVTLARSGGCAQVRKLKKVGVSVGWTGEREEEGRRGPTVAIEAEVREDTTEAHPDEDIYEESIGLRVIVPFRAPGEAYSR